MKKSTEDNIVFGIKNEWILLLTSLIIFLLLAFFINRPFIGSDGRSYQRIAVNIAKGNGYSGSIEAPFQRQFFREPGYPFFFSIACTINKGFGNENIPLSYRDENPGYHNNNHKEILILRILQAILASLTICIFYKTLCFFLKTRIAALIAFLLIFYLPFSVFITFPQREILVTLLLTSMGFFFLKSATSKSIVYDVLFGLISVALVLTLQAYIYILPVFLVSHYFLTKHLKKTFKSVSIIGVVFILGVAPWTMRGYNEAGNIKALKSFGSSYTYEFRNFHNANAKAYRMNIDANGESFKNTIIEAYGESGKLMYEKSFNGYYNNYADSLNTVIESYGVDNRYKKFSESLKQVISVNFRKALIWPFWKPDYRKNISTILYENKTILLSLLIGIIIGFFSIIGMILFIGKIWYYMPVFVFHFLMIPIMADEGRRMLPFIPFYFMFFVLGLLSIVIIIRHRITLDKIETIHIKIKKRFFV